MFRVAVTTILVLLATLDFGQGQPSQSSPEVQKLLDAAMAPSLSPAGKISVLEKALAKARELKDAEGEAYTLGNLGHFHTELHHVDVAFDYFHQSIAKFHQLKDVTGEMLTESELGIALDRIQHFAEALQACQHSLLLAQQLGKTSHEAVCFLNIAGIQNEMGRPNEALQAAQRALSNFHDLHSTGDEAMAQSRLSSIYGSLDRYGDAVAAGKQAIEGFRSLKDAGNEAMSDYGLGVMAYHAGHIVDSEAFFASALEIFRRLHADEGAAHTLSDWGTTNYVGGRLPQATERYTEAISLAEKIGDLRLVAADLENIGRIYLDQGDTVRALEFTNRALGLSRKNSDRRGEGQVLNGLGVINEILGKRELALDDYKKSLAIDIEFGDGKFAAIELLNIGKVYRNLGEYPKALDYFEQAVDRFRLINNEASMSIALADIGVTQCLSHRPLLALKALDQALEIQRSRGLVPYVVDTLYGKGGVYQDMGNLPKAEELFKEGLDNARKIHARRMEGILLISLGIVSNRMGKFQAAISLCRESLPIDKAIGNREGEAQALATMAAATQSTSPELAIFLFKRSVNVFQSLRSDISHLEGETRSAYTVTVAEAYRELASLLVENGRLVEAEQVLGLLKDEEFYEFVRRADRALRGNASYTVAEAGWDREYEAQTKDLVAIGREEQALLTSKDRSPAQEARLKQLEPMILAADRAFREFLDRILAKSRLTKLSAKHTGLLTGRRSIQATLGQLPRHSAAVYTLLGPNALQIIFVTANVAHAQTVHITPAELNVRVDAFRASLQNPSLDPRAPGKALYDILVKPIEADLASAKATHVMWSLDGTLRYIPLAALWDGRRYLLLRMSLTVFNPSSADKLAVDPKRTWRALAAGVSRGRTVTDEGGSVHKFPPLAAVPQELASVTRTFPGSKELLDPDFTIGNLESQLSRKPNLVHLATHFSFGVGDETKSFLLTGSGPLLSVGRARTLAALSLKNVSLFTLSACNTGLGGTYGDGSEVEGIAVVFQKKGAEVWCLSSLWPVSVTYCHRTAYVPILGNDSCYGLIPPGPKLSACGRLSFRSSQVSRPLGTPTSGRRLFFRATGSRI